MEILCLSSPFFLFALTELRLKIGDHNDPLKIQHLVKWEDWALPLVSGNWGTMHRGGSILDQYCILTDKRLKGDSRHKICEMKKALLCKYDLYQWHWEIGGLWSKWALCHISVSNGSFLDEIYLLKRKKNTFLFGTKWNNPTKNSQITRLAMWEVITHTIMGISICTCSFPETPFLHYGATSQAVNKVASV